MSSPEPVLDRSSECRKCGHKWLSRKQKRSRSCPKCGSRTWTSPDPPMRGRPRKPTIVSEPPAVEQAAEEPAEQPVPDEPAVSTSEDAAPEGEIPKL